MHTFLSFTYMQYIYIHIFFFFCHSVQLETTLTALNVANKLNYHYFRTKHRRRVAGRSKEPSQSAHTYIHTFIFMYWSAAGFKNNQHLKCWVNPCRFVRYTHAVSLILNIFLCFVLNEENEENGEKRAAASESTSLGVGK